MTGDEGCACQRGTLERILLRLFEFGRDVFVQEFATVRDEFHPLQSGFGIVMLCQGLDPIRDRAPQFSAHNKNGKGKGWSTMRAHIMQSKSLDFKGIGRPGYETFVSGEAVGRVTSGTQTPFLKKAIGMALMPIGHATPETEFEVEIRGRRARARVVPMPFYKRPRS